MSKLYLRNTTTNAGTFSTAEKSTALPVDAVTNATLANRDLKTAISTGATQNIAITFAATATNKEGYFGKWISDPLVVNTIDANTWTLGMTGGESNTNLNAFTVGSIYVLTSSDTVRGFVYDSHTSLGVEWGTSQTGQLLSVSGAQVTGVVSTDRLVFELWIHTANTMTVSYNFTYFYDGTDEVDAITNTKAGAYISTPQDLFTVPAITKAGIGISEFTSLGEDVFNPVETGSGISPRTALGADVFNPVETGLGASAFTTLGADVFSPVETGSGITAFTASGPKTVERTFVKQNTAISPFTALGSDIFTTTETGAGISPRTASGADVFTASETGTGISARTVLGADVITFTETGIGIISFVGSGSKVYISGSGNIYTKTGSGITAFTALGSDANIFTEAGAAISFFAASGSDVFTATETGLGVIVMTAAGFWEDALEIPCLYLPLTVEIVPHTTSVQENLISYIVTVDDPTIYAAVVTDSPALTAVVEDVDTDAIVEDNTTTTEVEMTSL